MTDANNRIIATLLDTIDDLRERVADLEGQLAAGGGSSDAHAA